MNVRRVVRIASLGAVLVLGSSPLFVLGCHRSAPASLGGRELAVREKRVPDFDEAEAAPPAPPREAALGQDRDTESGKAETSSPARAAKPAPVQSGGSVAAAPLAAAPLAGGVLGGSSGLGSAGGTASRPPVQPAPRNDLPREEPVGTSNRFARSEPNPFVETERDARSTFAIDVDTASYTFARRFLNEGRLPPGEAVRVEEFVNYFKYRYPSPEKGAFSVSLEGAPSPFGSGRTLVKVGLQGKQVSKSQRKRTHLVFLVDTSGSMSSTDKLPLAKEAVKIAVNNLNENDTVAIVTYAGNVSDVLAPTPATDRAKIFAALDRLQSGGGTAMGSGMELAYQHAVKQAKASEISRVVVLTDGDTNIGPNLGADAMLKSVEKYVAEGVTLSTIGFGMGNYRDDLMERLADKGNGNCFYVDGIREAKKVFEQKIAGTLEVIAKDVKIQVEFDPATVKRYRLLGYENRDIADRDFRNDKVDAGEIGAGHSVTALYEVELTDAPGDLATVRVRAKAPNGTEASEQQFRFGRDRLASSLEAASKDLQFATAVAATADVLRGNPDAVRFGLGAVERLASGATEGDRDREEFVTLLRKARALRGEGSSVAGR